MKIIKALLACALLGGTACPTFAASPKEQILRDLCTLTNYVSAYTEQVHQAHLAAFVLYKANIKYPLNEMRETLTGLASIYAGSKYLEDLDSLFTKLMTSENFNRSNTNIPDICRHKEYSGLRLEQINDLLYDKIFPVVKANRGEITGDNVMSVKSQTDQVISTYLTLVWKELPAAYYDIASEGSSMMDYYLEHGTGQTDMSLNPVPFQPTLSLQELKNEITKLGLAKNCDYNPLYWYADLATGFIFNRPLPTTIRFWKLYARPLPDIRDFYQEALTRIKNGSFQEWWKKQAPN